MKRNLKKILPQSIVNSIKSANHKLEFHSIKIASSTRFLSDVYYFIKGDFSEEHQSVLKGRKAYYESLSDDIGESCALLRRNTHRLEKGLIMRSRRDVFAEGFILETVECYKDAITSPSLANTEKKWATDVLDEYFKVVGSTPVTYKAKEIYTSARKDVSGLEVVTTVFPSDSASFRPYPFKNLPSSNIEFEDLKSLFISRRSVRWYQDKPVPLELLQKAANIASFAPSACNRQPYRFLFCNNKKKTVAIANCAMGTAGFSENLPAIIAIVGDLSAYPAERDRHVIYIDSSLAAMQLMLALETLGLSTCPINWPDIDIREKQIRNIIDLRDYERIVMLMAVGYADPDGGIPYSQKKENNLILKDIS